jgi:hypothetical protein
MTVFGPFFLPWGEGTQGAGKRRIPTLFTSGVKRTGVGTSWSHLLYCLRSMWQYSELLDHTFSTLFEICDSIRNFLITPVLFEMCQYSELLDHTCTVYELCDSIRNFLIKPVLFSKRATVFGTCWSHLYSFRNTSVFRTSWSHLYCLRNMRQYSELLDRTSCTLFEISDNIRWRNLTVVFWRMAQIDIDFWTLSPALNPMSIRVGFVVVMKVVLRQFIL